MSDQPADVVWQLARQRVLTAFDRQRAIGIQTHGQPLPVSIPGMDMADERLYELVDAIVYETAELMQREALQAENARIRSALREMRALVDLLPVKSDKLAEWDALIAASAAGAQP